MGELSVKWRLLAWLGDALGKPTETLPPGEARHAFSRSCAGPAFVMGVRAEALVVRDERVAGVAVRRFTPPSARPGVLVFFHGGGWVLGSPTSHELPAAALAAATQHEVVSVDYRLAPEDRYPAARDDCLAVTLAVAANAPVVVAGDSAGGNLAAVVANQCAERGVVLRAQVLLYPVTDCAEERASYAAFASGFLLTRSAMRYFRDQYVPEPEQRLEPGCSPLRATSLRGVAPALLLLSACDVLRDEGRAYADKLRADGVEAEVDELPLLHGFFNLQGMREGKAATARIAQWLAPRW